MGLVVLLLGGGLVALGHNPVKWAKDRWNDLQNNLVQVADVRAIGLPTGSEITNYPASSAVDGVPETAWAAAWTATTKGPAQCTPPADVPPAGSPGSLQLALDHSVTVRAISIAAGLGPTDPLRPHEWRPKTLQLAFSDGQCRQLSLKDDGALQRLAISPPIATTAIRISIVDTFQASTDQPVDVIAISEVQLFSRP